MTMVGDRLFKVLDSRPNIAAFAEGSHIYLRKDSPSILSEAVHEGSHALDFNNRFGAGGSKSVQQWEVRARYFERQFQLHTGGSVDFPGLSSMLDYVRKNYGNVPYNSY